jgi:CAAX prenyl protease-like protein
VVLALFWPKYGELRGARSVAPSQWLLAIVVGLGVFVAWIHLDHPGIAFEAGRGFDPTAADGRIDPVLAGMRLVGLALVVPVMEELFWRSFLMRWIDSRDFLAADPGRPSAFAFAATCGLFAMEHSLWLAGLVAGAAYGILYARTRNLWVPILSHAVTNGVLGVWIVTTGNWRFW